MCDYLMAVPNTFFRNRTATSSNYGGFRSYGTTSPESWPGLSRPSTSYLLRRRKKDVDAREDGVPAASRGGVSLREHDGGEVIRSHREPLYEPNAHDSTTPHSWHGVCFATHVEFIFIFASGAKAQPLIEASRRID